MNKGVVTQTRKNVHAISIQCYCLMGVSVKGYNMKPGRELDVIVAEKAMKFSRRAYSEVGAGWRDDENSTFYPDYTDSLPFFSSDISAAWEVVEKVKASTFNWSSGSGFWDGNQTGHRLVVELKGDQEGKWSCVLRDENWNHYVYVESADSAPHAICLAALEAVGEEV